MKRIKRVVDTSFWSDEKVLDFSPEDKYFMLYLLTNQHTTQLGVYHLAIKKASFDLGYTQDSVRVLLERFQNKYGIIRYSESTSEIAIKNYLLYSIVSGGKPVLDCLLSDMEAVRDKSLLTFIYNSLVKKDITNVTVVRFLTLLKESINDNDNESIVGESPHESYHESSRTSSKFIPPTLEEVEAYCKERNNKVNPKSFFDYFTTGGWKDSKGNPVKNWKQKIITWEKFETQPQPKKESKFNQMIHTDYDFDAIEKEILQ